MYTWSDLSQLWWQYYSTSIAVYIGSCSCRPPSPGERDISCSRTAEFCVSNGSTTRISWPWLFKHLLVVLYSPGIMVFCRRGNYARKTTPRLQFSCHRVKGNVSSENDLLFNRCFYIKQFKLCFYIFLRLFLWFFLFNFPCHYLYLKENTEILYFQSGH